MKRSLAAAILVLFLLPGCLKAGESGPGEDAGGSTSPPVAAPRAALPFHVSGCKAIIGIIGVPAAKVQPHVPEGFRVLPVSELVIPGAPNPNSDGNFGVEVFSCESVSGVGPEPSSGPYGSFFAAVEPPEGLRRDVSYHFVKWDVVVPEPGLLAALAAAGVPAWSGDSSIELMAVGPTPGPGRGRVELGDNWTVDFEAAPGAPSPPLEKGSFVEYTPVPGGLVAWSANYTWSALSVAPVSVTASAGSLAAEVLGTGPARGSGFVGTLDWKAEIALPD